MSNPREVKQEVLRFRDGITPSENWDTMTGQPKTTFDVIIGRMM